MSYIRAHNLDLEEGTNTENAIRSDLPARPELDMNLDDEILDFVLALIGKVNALREGEALVVWKEIF